MPKESTAPPEPAPRIEVEELYREHARAIYAWACLRLGSLQEVVTAADLAQEVWLRATRIAGGYDAQCGPPRAWLFTIAKHVLFEVQRSVQKHRKEKPAAGSTTRLLALDQVPIEVTSLTQRIARDDAVRAFLHSVQALDDTDRMLLIHVGLEAMPQTEAAARLGVAYDTLAKRWQRLRERMKNWKGVRELVSA